MKKYIGITIFLVSLIVASFWIALSSGKLKININTQENKIKKSNTKTNLTKLDNKVDKQDNTKENNKTEINVNYNSWDISEQENIESENIESGNTKNIDSKNKSKEDTLLNNKNIDNSEQNHKVKNSPKEFLFIWLSQANLYTWNKYKDIFSMLELENIPTYKIENKDIYIKELNSIEYKDEKNIISQLIQKIWGNIVETNLFWDKQLFVNPDIFYKKEVIMLVEYEWKLYLVVLPYKKYHEYKKFIKEVLFIKS